MWYSSVLCLLVFKHVLDCHVYLVQNIYDVQSFQSFGLVIVSSIFQSRGYDTRFPSVQCFRCVFSSCVCLISNKDWFGLKASQFVHVYSTQYKLISFIRIDLKVCYSLIHSYTIHADKLQLTCVRPKGLTVYIVRLNYKQTLTLYARSKDLAYRVPVSKLT